MALEDVPPYVVSISSHGDEFISPILELFSAFRLFGVGDTHANLVVEEGEELPKGIAAHDFVVSFLLFVIS